MNKNTRLFPLIEKHPLRENSLNGKNIFITGAGDGIGKAAALRCAELGATTILLGRTQAKLETVCEEIVSKGFIQPLTIHFDLTETDEERYKEIGNYIDSQFEQIDGLVLNAGILGEMSHLMEYNASTFAEVMQVNVNSQFLMSKHLSASLEKANHSSAVLVSSTVGRIGIPFGGAYSISKFALEGMMLVWFAEIKTNKEKASHIRVNSLDPGATRTQMRRQAAPEEDPMTVQPVENVAEVLAFLMGDESLNLNGHQLTV